jgi:hypothetical protein
MNSFNYRNCWMVVGVLAFLPIVVQGQTRLGSVTMKAGVSEFVALSAGSTMPQHNLRIDAQGDPGSLTLTLSGSATDVVEVRVPILIRSNNSYNVSALVRSQAATLASFVVLDARPIGRFVATDALTNLNVTRELDRRATNGEGQITAANSLPLNLSTPLSILSGPRVSLAGTLNSADNALEVIILIAVNPDAGATGWITSVSFSGSPRYRF